jgi:hypothetical protein
MGSETIRGLIFSKLTSQFSFFQNSHYGLNSSAVIVPVVAGLALMTAFIAYALRTKNTPVLDLHLFKSRNFSASIVLLFLTGFITNGAMLLLPLYYQQVHGDSVLLAIELFSRMAGSLVDLPLAGRICSGNCLNQRGLNFPLRIACALQVPSFSASHPTIPCPFVE